jgi:hypothetical protein
MAPIRKTSQAPPKPISTAPREARICRIQAIYLFSAISAKLYTPGGALRAKSLPGVRIESENPLQFDIGR